jgi:iron complex outermembrane receptor protein
VGDGQFYGFEAALDITLSSQLAVGGNYTALSREIQDGLQPNLRPTGVPTHKAFVYASWRPVEQLTITPSLDIAGDRWSDVNTTPLPSFPYIRTGSYSLFDISAQYSVMRTFDVAIGMKNIGDQNVELAWGFPQPGRTFYVKTRVGL